jgi:hypothetical protein
MFCLTLTNSICHSQAEIILLDGPFNYFVTFLPFSRPNVWQAFFTPLQISAQQAIKIFS